MLDGIITLISLPVGLLNFGGGIVGGIWLLILGKWFLVTSGLFIGIFGHYILWLLLSPGYLFQALSMKLIEKKSITIAYISIVIGYIFNYIAMLFWCLCALIFILNNHNSGLIWPYLLFAYSVATSPWTYIVSSETSRSGNAPGTIIPVFFLCIGVMAMIGVIIFGNPTVFNLTLAFIISMCPAFIIQTIMFFITARAYRKYE
jgi:hypothetical protein